jgi:hypothetical protein
VSGQLQALPAVIPRKEASVLAEQKAGWAPEQVWTFLRTEKYIAGPGNQTTILLTPSPQLEVTIQNTLARLHTYTRTHTKSSSDQPTELQRATNTVRAGQELRCGVLLLANVVLQKSPS